MNNKSLGKLSFGKMSSSSFKRNMVYEAAILETLTSWKKIMTNLDSILKNRDVTLPAKVCLVKAMVFPVVMYGFESWTIKKDEHQRSVKQSLCF